MTTIYLATHIGAIAYTKGIDVDERRSDLTA